MGRCKGKTANGHRCMRQLPGANGYCSQHREQRTLGEAILLGVGAFAGHALVPGLGGAVGGALGAKVLQALADEPTRKPRVFVSFDFDNDQALKHLLVGQTQRGDVAFQDRRRLVEGGGAGTQLAGEGPPWNPPQRFGRRAAWPQDPLRARRSGRVQDRQGGACADSPVVVEVRQRLPARS